MDRLGNQRIANSTNQGPLVDLAFDYFVRMVFGWSLTRKYRADDFNRRRNQKNSCRGFGDHIQCLNIILAYRHERKTSSVDRFPSNINFALVWALSASSSLAISAKEF